MEWLRALTGVRVPALNVLKRWGCRRPAVVTSTVTSDVLMCDLSLRELWWPRLERELRCRWRCVPGPLPRELQRLQEAQQFAQRWVLAARGGAGWHWGVSMDTLGCSRGLWAGEELNSQAP